MSGRGSLFPTLDLSVTVRPCRGRGWAERSPLCQRVASPSALPLALVAPTSAGAAPAPASATTTPSAARPARPIVLRLTYKVVAGDTLAGIARKHAVRLDDLRKLNRLKLTS